MMNIKGKKPNNLKNTTPGKEWVLQHHELFSSYPAEDSRRSAHTCYTEYASSSGKACLSVISVKHLVFFQYVLAGELIIVILNFFSLLLATKMLPYRQVQYCVPQWLIY